MPISSTVDSGNVLTAVGSVSENDVNLIDPIDVSSYKWLTLYIGPDEYTGVLSYHVSFDLESNNWTGCLLYNSTSLDGGDSTYTTTAQNIIGIMPIVAPYFRVRMTDYVEGTATAILKAYREPPAGLQLLTTNVRIFPGTNTIGYIRNDGVDNYAIAAGVATDTAVSDTGGILARILVTTQGTADMEIYDNNSTATGTIIGIVPANTARGTIIECKGIADAGIMVKGNANNPGVTIFYA